MNIFVVNRHPITAARDLCDKHCVKMILETAQLLCAAHPKGTAPYKQTHMKHPCTIWTSASLQNYIWLYRHGIALEYEYERRYGRTHKSMEVLVWCGINLPSLPDIGLTPFAQAMPEQYKDADPVVAYRRYYLGDKSRIAKWNHSDVPEWYATKNPMLGLEVMA
jgi:hypothetical protein